MGTRAWLNVLLLIAILALAAIVYFEPGIKQPVAQPLTSIQASTVNEIQIDVPEQESVVLRRNGQHWQVAAPKQIRANPIRVEKILNLLTATSEQQYSATGLDLNKYGFAAPKARLRVAGLELAFGDLDPLNSRRYVLIGQTLHLIDQSDIAILTNGWPSLVDLKLFPEGRELAAIEISGLGTLKREPSGWQYTGRVKASAQTAIDALVQAWNAAQAMEVETNETEATGEKVVLRFRDGDELHFDINRFADQTVLGRADLEIEYHLSNAQAQQLLEFEVPAETGSGKTETPSGR